MKKFETLIQILAVSISLQACSNNKATTIENANLQGLDHFNLSESNNSAPEATDPNLWHENWGLTLKEFYNKYESEFKNYKTFKPVLSFNGDSMVGSDGRTYPPFSWDSQFGALEKKLTDESGDYFKAHLIIQAYKRNISDFLKADHLFQDDATKKKFRSVFDHALITNIPYFGSSHGFMKNKLTIYKEMEPFFTNKNLADAYYKFITEINHGLHIQLKDSHPTKEKITIITGPYGGGHLSTAEVIKSSLQGHFELKEIDECKDFPDRLTIAVGIPSCRVYNDIFIKESDQRKATLLWILNFKLNEYIADNRFHNLYEHLKTDNPTLIISTIHHINPVTAMAYLLDTPMRIMVTDYGFPSAQWDRINHEDPRLLKYWIPTEESNIFRELVRKRVVPLDRWDYRLGHTRTFQIFEKLFTEKKTLPQILPELEVFDFLPFPVSSLIEPPKSEVESMESRKKLGLTLNPNREVVAISYGGAGNPELVTGLVKKIVNIAPQLSKKIQIAVLSSGNAALLVKSKEALETLRVPMIEDETRQVTSKVLDRLKNPDEMLLLYKAIKILIGKSGGATTAELLNSNTFFVRGFALWPWEIENSKFLEEIGLAHPEVPSTDPLTEDLDRYKMDVTEADLLQEMNSLLAKPRPTLAAPRFEGPKLVKMIEDAIQFHQERTIQLEKDLVSEERLIEQLRDQRHFEIFDHRSLASGLTGRIFRFDDPNRKPWAVKILKDTGATPEGVQGLVNENQGNSALTSLYPENAVHSELFQPNVILKEFVDGKTLLELLNSNELNDDESEKLFQLFEKLSMDHKYVLDLHGGNLIYSPSRKSWVIVDHNGVEDRADACQAYVKELTEHWKSEEIATKVKVQDILIDRLNKTCH